MPVATLELNINNRPAVGHTISLYEVVGANMWGIHLEDGPTNYNGQYTPATILDVGKSYTLEIDVGPAPPYVPSVDDYRYSISGDYTLANWIYHDYRRRLYIVFDVPDDNPIYLAVNIVPPVGQQQVQQQAQAPQSQVMQEGDIIVQPQTDYLPIVITVVGTIVASAITAAAIVYSQRK